MMGVCDGCGISWTTCKQSAPCCRQITTPINSNAVEHFLANITHAKSIYYVHKVDVLLV